LLISLVLGLSALALVASAAAAGPVITFDNDATPQTIIDWGDCPGFQIDATFMAQRRNETFYDAGGDPLLQRRHVQFTGTLYNGDEPSKNVVYSGDFTRTFDFTTSTLTITGLSAHVLMRGAGVILLSAGEVTVDLGSGEVVTRGPSGDLTRLCANLS
jgi:hypothetical protein